MNDRELLEAAAEAAGIVGEMADTDYAFWIDRHKGLSWNPLTDDGDALRLAVSLELELEFAGHKVRATSYNDDGQEFPCREESGFDKFAAVRRAIVRAAAAIRAASRTGDAAT